MPIFELNDEIVFPHPSYAEEDGLLAIGGDLSPNRILNAYINGIFPWFSPEDPILWWSPNPRCVLFPEKFKVSKSLQSIVRKNIFKIQFNTCFEQVMRECAAAKRSYGEGTWITDEMIAAYTELHNMGWAHSVEVYLDNELVGGLYGMAIGNVFFGESMFYKVSNASKVAFHYLVDVLKKNGFKIIDNQTTTEHLLSLGAEEIDREEFLSIIHRSTEGFKKLVPVLLQ